MMATGTEKRPISAANQTNLTPDKVVRVGLAHSSKTLAKLLDCSMSGFNTLRKQDFPKPDFYVGNSPRWTQTTVLGWIAVQQAKGGR